MGVNRTSLDAWQGVGARGGDNAYMATSLFLCGDVMTGRGIDQVLPHPSRPHLFEPYVRDAREYVELAERASGPVGRARDFAYVWGDALEELEARRPDARIANLETAVTTSEDAWPGKGINYRMHPGNVPCLAAARLDCCVLANNHVLDWGRAGLAETLRALSGAGIRTAGAGMDLGQARSPAVLDTAGGSRVLVFAYASESSGVPADWAARPGISGVSLLEDLSPRTVDAIAGEVAARRREGDIVVVSIHWGSNWGYEVAREQRRFAHGLVEVARADVVHGHSSHHPRAVEIHRGRPILYGCGDFLNDYEGIEGHEEFRPELCLMYFARFGAGGSLQALEMVPMRVRRFRLERASAAERRWIAATMSRESARLGTAIQLQDGSLRAAD
jgi:poly-gamma-glutamate synthesis protein (capsule biosynthesis protein)